MTNVASERRVGVDGLVPPEVRFAEKGLATMADMHRGIAALVHYALRLAGEPAEEDKLPKIVRRKRTRSHLRL